MENMWLEPVGELEQTPTSVVWRAGGKTLVWDRNCAELLASIHQRQSVQEALLELEDLGQEVHVLNNLIALGIVGLAAAPSSVRGKVGSTIRNTNCS